jgi:uncharacterized protein (DUF433 family)
VVRRGSAKPLFGGSNPPVASNFLALPEGIALHLARKRFSEQLAKSGLLPSNVRTAVLTTGTTLRVSDLAACHTMAGLTPDQLSAQFDLDLAQVHAALSYYFRNKAAVDAEIRANADQAELWRQRQGIVASAGLDCRSSQGRAGARGEP